LTKTQDDLPIPPLLAQQVQASLRRLGVEVRECDGEADIDLAFACQHSWEVLHHPAYVLGWDSDFHLFAGVRYLINFNVQMSASKTSPSQSDTAPNTNVAGHGGDGNSHQRESTSTRTEGTVATAQVWTRAALGVLLELSESKLVQLACLLGTVRCAFAT
jgi:hypothetical protein